MKLLSAAAQAPLKLNSMRRGITARSSGSSKKSMSVQPATLEQEMVVPLSPKFMSPVRALISQRPNRLFTPSTPNPVWGQPKPRATVVGKARGNDAAEKKDIAKVGVVCPSFGVTKIFVASSTFSGIDRNEGTSYLRHVEKDFYGDLFGLPVLSLDERILASPHETFLGAVWPCSRMNPHAI